MNWLGSVEVGGEAFGVGDGQGSSRVANHRARHFRRLVYRLDLGYRDRSIGLEYDGLEFHDLQEQTDHDEKRRSRLDREFGWQTYGFHRGDVLGRRPTVELAVGELLSLEPLLPRTW